MTDSQELARLRAERDARLWEYGAISIAKIDQQINKLSQEARAAAQNIGEGSENHGEQRVLVQKGPGYRGDPRLAPVNDYQVEYGKAGAERMGHLTEGSTEANVAIGYNKDTQQYGFSGYVKSRAGQGTQQAYTPALPPGRWLYAGQAHGHHGMTDFSPNDRYWANVRGLPIFIQRRDGTSMYVPPRNPAYTSALVGEIFRPGEF